MFFFFGIGFDGFTQFLFIIYDFVFESTQEKIASMVGEEKGNFRVIGFV